MHNDASKNMFMYFLPTCFSLFLKQLLHLANVRTAEIFSHLTQIWLTKYLSEAKYKVTFMTQARYYQHSWFILIHHITFTGAIVRNIR
jgi:hypothetical protein